MGKRVEGRKGSDPWDVGDGSAEATQHRRSHQKQMDRCKSLFSHVKKASSFIREVKSSFRITHG